MKTPESRYARSALFVTRASFIALGASIPISVALDGVLTGLIALSWLAAARFRETVQAVRSNPVALFACVWFLAHVLGALYSVGETREIVRSIGKAAIFLIIPIAVAVLDDPRDRERALYAFMAAIGATVVLSCLRWAGAIPPEVPWLKSTADSASVVFKFHLTQNLLVALGAFVFAVQSVRARSQPLRRLYAALAAVAVVNVLFVGDGRTGQIVLMLLMLHFGYWRFGKYGVAAALVPVMMLAAAAYLMPQSTMHKRAAQAIAEAQNWQPGSTEEKPKAVGDRLEYYSRSLNIISAHPLAGVGTGGFPAAYETEVRGTSSRPTRNPHSEYLLKTAEFGLAGLLLMLGLFWTGWRSAARLQDEGHSAIARALVLMFGCASIGTSTFNDHTEALLFVWLSGVLFSGLPETAAAARPAPLPREAAGK